MRADQILVDPKGGGERQRFEITCDQCGKTDSVPFKPSTGVPYYAVSVLARVAQLSREPELLSSEAWIRSSLFRRVVLWAAALSEHAVRLLYQFMSYETIQLEMRDAVAVITLNRPESLNALTTEVGQEFQAAVDELRQSGARAVVLTGAGRAFCAGGDLREMRGLRNEEGKVEAFFDEPLRMLNECILLIRQTPLPFIAAVNGAASGGGCNLALACDLVIAGESARFNQAFIKIGLVPDCGGTFILAAAGWLETGH